LGWGGKRLPLPLGCLSSRHALGLGVDGVEDEDTSFALLDAIEEDFHWVNKGKRLKIKGGKEVLNLKSFINYGDASVPSKSRKGKAQVL
jgi:hypothetical protein